jgi:hypothetical protein
MTEMGWVVAMMMWLEGTPGPDWLTVEVPLWALIAVNLGQWFLSAFVNTMPEPLPMERWYGWFYRFMQFVTANKPGLIFKPKEKGRILPP